MCIAKVLLNLTSHASKSMLIESMKFLKNEKHIFLAKRMLSFR